MCGRYSLFRHLQLCSCISEAAQENLFSISIISSNGTASVLALTVHLQQRPQLLHRAWFLVLISRYQNSHSHHVSQTAFHAPRCPKRTPRPSRDKASRPRFYNSPSFEINESPDPQAPNMLAEIWEPASSPQLRLLATCSRNKSPETFSNPYPRPILRREEQ
jgi:hypothetical protein